MAPVVQQRLGKKLYMLDKISTHSRKVAEFYKSEIKTDRIIQPSLPKESHVIFARYPLRAKNKKMLLRMAKKKNLELADWYNTTIHPIPAEQAHVVGYTPGSCPNAEQRSDEIVSLPVHLGVTSGYLAKVKNFFETN